MQALVSPNSMSCSWHNNRWMNLNLFEFHQSRKKLGFLVKVIDYYAFFIKQILHVGGLDIICMHYAGKEVVVYESPQPSAGIHRLVFVLFQQLGRDTVITPDLRHNFNSRDFAENNNLTPVAAAYVNCQRERGCGGRRY